MGVWEARVLDTDLSRIVINPSLWQGGKVHGVFNGYLFIKPDLGPPNVMCLPSTTPDDYEPFVGERVMFRAGPSEKRGSQYQQAIDLRQDCPTSSTHGSSTSHNAQMVEGDLCDSDTDVAVTLCDSQSQNAQMVERDLCDSHTDLPATPCDSDTSQNAQMVQDNLCDSDTDVRQGVWRNPNEAVESDTDVQ